MIFYVNICYYGDCSLSDEPQCKDVLFVHWFGHDPTYSSIFQSCQLSFIGFLPEDDLDAFGFLDPDLVIQGVHLILSFLEGQTSNLLVGVKTSFTPEVTPRKSKVEGGWDLASPYVVRPCLHAQWSHILGLVGGGDKDLS